MNGNANIIDDESRAYQEETASLRFKQNMVHGIGAAMVFGIATAACGVLLKSALVGETIALSAASALPLLAVAVIITFGIGCLYFSSKYTSQLVRIEQDHHAKQIAKGIKGKSPEMAQQKPVPFPSQDNAVETQIATTLQSATNDDKMKEALPTVSNIKLKDKVVSLDEARKVRA